MNISFAGLTHNIRYRLTVFPFVLLSRTKKNRSVVERVENIPYSGPFIFVSNHQHNEEVFALFARARKLWYRCDWVTWVNAGIDRGDYGFWPGKFVLKFFPHLNIDKQEFTLIKLLDQSLDYLSSGNIIYLAPEGTKYPHGELGPFGYGIANLARMTPVPIVPFGTYRRKESDNGVQINVGKPFFLPSNIDGQAASREDDPLDSFTRKVDMVRELCSGLKLDKDGMGIIEDATKLISNEIRHSGINFEKYCYLGNRQDVEYIRDKVLELLPPGWKKVARRSD